jgi:hypothetical protein
MTPRAIAAGPWPLRLLALGILALAFAENHVVTQDLTWPAFDIQYRETAVAQTFLDEGQGPDPSYRGEALWYNPFSGWLLALTSAVTGVPVHEVMPRIGPYVNLLAPVAFFVLVAALVNEGTALVATAGFLFFTANSFPFWLAASYSPWFAPENYGQGLLYASLTLAALAHRRGWPLRWQMGLGLALGATFLVHTAPALILGVTLVLLAGQRVRQGRAWRHAVGGLAVSLAVALVTSLALVWPLVGRYHLATVNPYPSESPTTILELYERPGLLLKLSVETPFLIAVAALSVHLWRRRRSAGGQVLLAWTSALLLLLACCDVRYLLRKLAIVIPTPIPTYHVLFHGMTLVSLGFGVAVAGLAQVLARRLARPGMDHAPVLQRLLAVAAVVVVVLGWVPHSLRHDATEVREWALTYDKVIPGDAYDWIRAFTRSEDVFVSTDDVSLFLVAPAGRKVVCTNRYFSNPFVDWAARDRDRDQMLALAREGDLEAFDRLAARWAVRYVVASDGLSPFLSEKAGIDPSKRRPLAREDFRGRSGFEPVFLGQGLGIYRRTPVTSSRSAGSGRPGA